MHHTRCLFSPSRALRNVFLAHLEPIPSTMARPIRATCLSPRPFSTSTAHLRIMIKGKGPRPAEEKKISRYPSDNAIPYKFVRIAESDGTLSEPQRTSDVLRDLNRQKYTLAMVAAPPASKVDEDADSLPADGRKPEDEPAAICRIIDKYAYAKAAEEKEKAARRKELNRKELELNWAIATNDLAHKLKQLREFLGKGRRVEVMLAKKRRGRTATKEEGEVVLTSLREAAEECLAKEVKSEGKFPGVVKLVFEGTSK